MHHKLYIRRRELGFSVKEVEELTGIDESTIYRIESGKNQFRINFDTALALASGLDTEVNTLFDPTELSGLGRTPKTGVPRQKSRQLREGIICKKCQVEIPLAHGKRCPTCN